LTRAACFLPRRVKDLSALLLKTPRRTELRILANSLEKFTVLEVNSAAERGRQRNPRNPKENMAVLDNRIIHKLALNEIFEYREREDGVNGPALRHVTTDSDIITAGLRSCTQMTVHIRKQPLLTGF